MKNKCVIITTICLLISCESSICKQFKPIYNKNIDGQVLKRCYCDSHGRRIGCIDIRDRFNQEYHFDWFDISKDLFDSIEAGDSISKLAHSTVFEFYRRGEFLGEINFECSPPDK
jgi:hypothetical protein